MLLEGGGEKLHNFCLLFSVITKSVKHNLLYHKIQTKQSLAKEVNNNARNVLSFQGIIYVLNQFSQKRLNCRMKPYETFYS